MAYISITWHTMGDDKVCPVCRAIDGYTWTFVVGKDQMTGQLIHPEHGVVWTVQDGSKAHGHRGACRCHLTHDVNIQDLLELSFKILEIVEKMPHGATKT